MPPKRNTEDVQTLKEKLHNTNARGRRTGGTQPANGSGLKEVDNASTHSGHTSSDLDTSNVSHRHRHRLTSLTADWLYVTSPHLPAMCTQR